MRIFKRHPYRRWRFNLLPRGGWVLVVALVGLMAAAIVTLWVR